MKTFEFNSIHESYGPLCRALVDEGTRVEPRGIPTRELTPVAITIADPRQNLIPSAVRKLNFGFMIAELLWILRGSNDAKEIAHYNANWLNFSDDGERLNGAYGKRIRAYRADVPVDQLVKAYELLKEDPLTRQATIVLFDPALDYRVTKDKPCTNLLRFKIRNDRLHMLTVMRSNDILLGYPYDVWNFTSLQAFLAGKLGVGLGEYVHVVDSLHVYEKDVSWAEDVANEQPINPYANGALWGASTDLTDDDLNVVLNVESISRQMCAGDSFHERFHDSILKRLEKIVSPYWRSNAAFIARYNARKAFEPQEVLRRYDELITNELSLFLDRFQAKVRT